MFCVRPVQSLLKRAVPACQSSAPTPYVVHRRARCWARTWTDGKVTIAPIKRTTTFPEQSEMLDGPLGA